MRHTGIGWVLVASVLVGCGGPPRPRRLVVDASGLAGRAYYIDEVDFLTTEQTHERYGLRGRARFETGAAGAILLGAETLYARRSRVRSITPAGQQQGPPEDSTLLWMVSAGYRGFSETRQTSLGVHVMLDDGQTYPWLHSAPLPNTGLGIAYAIGSPDPLLVGNLVGVGLGGGSGPLEVQAMLSCYGQWVHRDFDERTDTYDMNLSRVDWGAWLQGSYAAEPFGVIAGVLLGPEPTVRVGMIWAWTGDAPAPTSAIPAGYGRQRLDRDRAYGARLSRRSD